MSCSGTPDPDTLSLGTLVIPRHCLRFWGLWHRLDGGPLAFGDVSGLCTEGTPDPSHRAPQNKQNSVHSRTFINSPTYFISFSFFHRMGLRWSI